MADPNVILNWLQSAYGMEYSLSQRLEQHLSDIEGHAELEPKVRADIARVKNRASEVAKRIKELGSTTSDLKSDLGSAKGILGGIMDAFKDDFLMKNVFGEYGEKHRAFAFYIALQAIAEELKDTQTSELCKAFLTDEENAGSEDKKLIKEAARKYAKALP